MKKVLLSLILPFYFIAVCSLLLSYLAPYVSPKSVWAIAFFGLAYPYLLLINLIFLVSWAIAKKKMVLGFFGCHSIRMDEHDHSLFFWL